MELFNEENLRELLLRLFIPIFGKAADAAKRDADLDFPLFSPEVESQMVRDLRLQAGTLGIPFPEVNTYDELDTYLFPEAGNQFDHESTTAELEDSFDELLAKLNLRGADFENSAERVANGLGLLQEARAKKLLSKKK